LSTARASAVAEYIISHSKINPSRISTMGFGEYRPIDTNETPEGRQKNRRVEIILSNLPKPSKVREF
jgi:chemotaxis protein MotB